MYPQKYKRDMDGGGKRKHSRKLDLGEKVQELCGMVC